MAEGELPGPSALITMIPGVFKPEAGRGAHPPQVTAVTVPTLQDLRVTLKGYVEPEAGDVDIAREPILIAVGRGIQNQDNLELAEELATALGGVVCASRPVVDQGWLPTTRLVGKSGKTVKPKIYLTLGISGAQEHAEGMSESETIIAINTDPSAPIFNLAKYGTTTDLFDLVPLLTEKVRQAK
jgi:electron transfer flavoprotein alpha subunit